MNKRHCIGCYLDRYNHSGMCERPGIDAPVVSKECWLFKSAKLVWKLEVGINQIPPYSQKAHRFPNCYRKSGYAYLNPKTANRR